jgi:mRNA interferase MazF
VRRGEIYTAAARRPYTGKPRPVAIIQDDRFDATASVTICPLTTHAVDAPLLRLQIPANEATGLTRTSWLMVDKITTMPRENLQDRLGSMSDTELLALGRALVVFLGLAG